ncbi:MAG TPA: hypothetical protein VJT73_06955 [Polyangiaceae bacterium]|nr:hypothetical protein [Polyangiaceae bacterium]
MARDSLFGDRIEWAGRPKIVTVPTGYCIGALVMAIVAAIALAFAILLATAIHAPVGPLVLFACWSATLSVALRYGPAVWRSEVEYIVTEKHVMWKRGRIRRTIDRSAISYARIHWHPSIPGLGDLELVRAVPTGALRRRLSLLMPGVMGPDRLWSIIRGVPASGGAGDGHRPLSQRLDEGERVLWSAKPISSWRKWIPVDTRQLLTAGIGVLVAFALVRELRSAVPAAKHILAAGLSTRSPAFISLVTAVVLTAVLLACVATGLGYVALVRPAQLVGQTRYLITDRRVLIQRGHEELCLDRARIVDVIDSPGQSGLHDIFLVLDGPRARAVAASGAFGERDIENGLVPVFHAVADAEEVSQILRFRSTPPPVHDAA